MRARRILRSRLAWPLALPILAGGLLAGHQLGYRLAISDGHLREHALQQSGHGYLRPALLVTLLAVAALAFAWRVVGGLRGRRAATAPAWLFGLLPPLAFAAQEHLERFFHHAEVPWTLSLQPEFAFGLILQLPFAAAAIYLARRLERVAETIVVVLRGTARKALTSFVVPQPAATALPTLRPLALACSERGPPSLP